MHLAEALENNVTLHTLVLSGNPGYSAEFGFTLDDTANTAHAKMQQNLEEGVDNGFWEENEFPAPFDMLSVVKKWKNEKVDLRKGSKPQAVEITNENPVPHLHECDPPTLAFRDLGLDASDSEDLDLGSSCWNDQNVIGEHDLMTDIGVDTLEYAVPFLQSPDKSHQNDKEEIDDFIRSDNDVLPAESRPPSRISLRSRKNNAGLPSPSIETPTQMYVFDDHDGIYIENGDEIERRRIEGNNVERPRSAKNARTYAKSIGEICANVDRPVSAPFDLSGSRERGKKLSRLPKKTSKANISTSSSTRSASAPVAKVGNKRDKMSGTGGKAAKSTSPNKISPHKKVSRRPKESLVRRMSSSTSVPSLLGRYVKSVHSKSVGNQTTNPIGITRTIPGQKKTSPPVKIKDPKPKILKSFGGTSGRSEPVTKEVMKMSVSKLSPSRYQVQPDSLLALATSVPVSKFKTVRARKASTPRSPPKGQPYRANSKSPIDEALDTLEENVAKRLNVAVSSVTANLEAVSRQLGGVTGGNSGKISMERQGADLLRNGGLQGQDRVRERDNTHLDWTSTHQVIDDFSAKDFIDNFEDYYSENLDSVLEENDTSVLPLTIVELIERTVREKLTERVRTAALGMLR